MPISPRGCATCSTEAEEALARGREIAERAAPSREKWMTRSARLLLLCLAAAGCGQRHGNIISIANSADLAPPANQVAPAGNDQASEASHDEVLRSETVSGTFAG